MTGGSRTALRVRMVCALVAAAALVPVASARAALTRIGRQTGLPAGATVAGPLDAGLRLHVTVTLRPRDPVALDAYARAVSTPGAIDYRHYLTPSQFADRFGAAAAEVTAVRDALRARGLSPGPTSPGALSISVVASVAELQRAFAVRLSRVTLPGQARAVAASAAPAFDTRAAGAVQSVVGLDTYAAPRPLLMRRPVRPGGGSLSAIGRPPAPGPLSAAGLSPLARPRTQAAGPQPCPQARASAPSQSAYTADQIAAAYGFPGLYAAGDQGAGVTVAVYELEANDPGDIAAYQSCYGTHAAVSYVPVDGGAGGGAGTGEAALDVENLIGLAPAANVLVYQGPNANSGDPGSGPYDTFSAIVNQDRASVVSVSWGQCEAALGQADAVAENTLFTQAAVQGQSIVAAAGDSGSADCDTGGALPQTGLAVDDPSSQPYVTGVGGTSLRAIGPPPAETVWNSGATELAGVAQTGAGGGGASRFWAMPAAQLSAAPGLGLRGAASGSGCGNATGYCRQVPDVSANADPSTGYLIYWNGARSVAGQPSGWQGIGGTSGAAPLWAALLTLADASRGCGGSRVGYANPALYRAAGSAYAADFNDITSGNNDFTGSNGGQYGATAGYDRATGLGTPRAAALASGLCADTVGLANPGPQRSAVRATVSIQVHGTDAAGNPLSYRAHGLPPGLRLDAATGWITGRPRRTGSFTVLLGAADAQSASALMQFTWTIGGPPRVSAASLAGGRSGPRLAFTVTSGRNAPALRSVRITLPHGLRFASGHGVSVTAGVTAVRSPGFTTRLSGDITLTLALRQASRSIRVTLAPPGLSAGAGRVPDTTERDRSRLRLTLSVVDAGSGASALNANLAQRTR